LLLKAPVLLYKWHVGWLLGRRFLLVNHVGRRSGRAYQTVVEVIGHRASRWYVMSGFGRSSDWYLNVMTAGSAEVRVGRRSARVKVRELDSPAAADVMVDYERRNRLITPIVRRALSRQVGWRYTGSDADRHRLVDQLPILELDDEAGQTGVR
jgi:deazaflavin-dependent oxidoreductase (nitroreductase family)